MATLWLAGAAGEGLDGAGRGCSISPPEQVSHCSAAPCRGWSEGQAVLGGVGGDLVLPLGRWHIILGSEILSSLPAPEVMASLVFLGRPASLLRIVF